MRAGTCGLYMDLVGQAEAESVRLPVPGDSVVSVRRDGNYGSGYLVRDVREVRRRDPQAPVRVQMRCRRVPVSEALSVAGACWQMSWYPRRRPA